MGPNEFMAALIEPFSHQLLVFCQIRNYSPTPSCDFLSNSQLTAPISTLHNGRSPVGTDKPIQRGPHTDIPQGGFVMEKTSPGNTKQDA